MKKIIFLLSVFGFLLFAGAAVAQQTLRYPIRELGFCRDAKECYLYCEIAENRPACWSYGKYILGSQILGQHTDSAERLGITFPIPELGNCANAAECRRFCEEPANHDACREFARHRGIGHYRKHREMLEQAREILGCNTFDECQALCQDPANQQRCAEFAEKFAPPEFRRRKEEMLKRARDVLGCDSFESCQAFCQNPDNTQQCSRFAEQHAPPEVREREERLSCNTEEECRRLCEENPDRCPGFKKSPELQRFREEQEKQRMEGEQRIRESRERIEEFATPSSTTP